MKDLINEKNIFFPNRLDKTLLGQEILDKINSKMRQPNFKKERIDSERKDDSNHQKRHSYPEQMSQECLEVYLLLIGHRLALEMEIS